MIYETVWQVYILWTCASITVPHGTFDICSVWDKLGRLLLKSSRAQREFCGSVDMFTTFPSPPLGAIFHWAHLRFHFFAHIGLEMGWKTGLCQPGNALITERIEIFLKGSNYTNLVASSRKTADSSIVFLYCEASFHAATVQLDIDIEQLLAR